MWFLAFILSIMSLVCFLFLKQTKNINYAVINLVLLFCNAAGLLLLQGMEFLFSFCVVFSMNTLFVINYPKEFGLIISIGYDYCKPLLALYLMGLLVLYREFGLKKPWLLLLISIIAHAFLVYFSYIWPLVVLYGIYAEWLCIQIFLLIFGKHTLINIGLNAEFLYSCGINSGLRSFTKATLAVLGGATIVVYNDALEFAHHEHAVNTIERLDRNVVNNTGGLTPEQAAANRKFALDMLRQRNSHARHAWEFVWPKDD